MGGEQKNSHLISKKNFPLSIPMSYPTCNLYNLGRGFLLSFPGLFS
jgi:hypothetical protein